jgi:16S rRNA (guanine(966)-N(2))-methyltransferase RsmD
MHILAGMYKGRKLLPPPGKSITRPITGMVKKSLFGMLGEDLAGQVVADLFCGTGTLGIEALSRGAERCYFAECDRAVLDRLRRNLRDVGAGARGVVWAGDVERQLAGWLAAVDRPLDVVFVDPPYAMAREWDWQAAAEHIFSPLAAKLDPGGTVVLRMDDGAKYPQELGPLKAGRIRTYGNMVLAMFGLAAS